MTTYEFVSVSGQHYYFTSVKALHKCLRYTYRNPHLTDRAGGYVWSEPEIKTATEGLRLVYVWLDREIYEDGVVSPVGIVRRARKTAAEYGTARTAARNDGEE